MATSTRPAARYTLHISTTTLSGGVTVEAMARKAIPAGIDGPFTASVRLDFADLTPADLAAHALAELHLDREFTAAGEPAIRVGYDGLYLEYPLTKLA